MTYWLKLILFLLQLYNLQNYICSLTSLFLIFFETVGKNIDKADNEINKVNKDLKDVLNDPASCCQNQILNLILCVVVLGIAGVVFNMVTKQNGQ